MRTDRQVRIAQLGPDPRGQGGMAAVVRDLVGSPLSELHRMDVIATWRAVRPLPRITIFVISLGKLTGWCLGRGPRIVHIHTAVRGSLYRKSIAVTVAKALRRPVILHVHAGVGDIAAFDERIGPVRRALFAGAFSLADRVLSVSMAGAQEIERRFGVHGIVVVPHAAPRVTLPPWSADMDPDRLRILFVGGFDNPAKGGTVLVEALPEIMAACPTADVTLAGPGQPPAAARGSFGRWPRLRWVGWLEGEAKALAFAATDIFLAPSITEGLPVALLEAMAYGLAIVATRAGGMPEVLTDDVDAVLVPPGDARALAEAARGLAHDPERRTRLGLAARARAATLNAEEVCARLDALYRELVLVR
jgi:glycosyltransferase involved in cell wall biosynthesis